MNFLDFCTHVHPLPIPVQEALMAITQITTKQKGEALLRQAGYCKQLFFIQKGLAKLCFQQEDKEFIMRFFPAGILFTEMTSLIKQQPSTYEIIALEPLEVVLIPYYKFEQLCREHHALETFFRKFLTIAHLNMMHRVSERLDSDAKQRYKNFLHQYPDLIQRISLGNLSNYLGITQVSLSRIRAEK
ncbi:MAG: Crp/Fnr family transcriptional regulator [Aureispira sp.]